MNISMENQDRIIFLIYLVLIAVPFIAPVGLPLPISSESREFDNQFDQVPEGGSILWCSDIAFSLWTEIGSGEIAIYKRLFTLAQEKDIKLVFISTGAEAFTLSDRTIQNDIKPKGFADGLTYGEDFVQLGWIPGWESAMAATAVDIHNAFQNDWYGTPMDQLPIMDDLVALNDFDLVGWGGYYVDEYARQWTGYNVPLIVNLSATTVSMAKPWFEQGLVNAYLNGQRGCAEFEVLTGYKGFATSAIDAQSIVHLYGVVILIVANVYYWWRRISGNGGN